MLRHRRRWHPSTHVALALVMCLMLVGALHVAPTALAATISLPPTNDSYIRGGTGLTQVYGTQPVLEINNSPVTSATYDRRAYLKFDVSGISGTVSSATLQLHVTAVPSGSLMLSLAATADTLSGAMSTTSWTESNVTRRYEPTRGDTITTAHIHSTGLVTLNVTDYVQQQTDGDNIASFVLVDDGISDHLVQIASKEGPAATAPVLSVTTGGQTEPPLIEPPAIGTNNGPFFQIPCATSHITQDDPIVYPGQNNAAHEHQFFGNTTTNENSTLTSLLAGGTTCTLDPNDTAAYWVPTLYDGQGMKVPYRARAYYYAHYSGSDRSTVLKTFPQGLKIIAGDAMATGAQPDGAIRWLCRDRNNQGPEQPLMSNNPPMCATDQYLSLMIRFPNCVAVHNNNLDTPRLDSSDHRRHMAYAEANQPCPSTHPLRVPKLRLSITYEVNGGYIGGNFTLGGPSGSARALPWYGMHADFFNSWDAAALNEYVEECLKTGQTNRPAGCNVVLNAP